jgi:putative peptide zinc metalloprotease protein
VSTHFLNIINQEGKSKVLEPESATTNTLPKLKTGLRIAPFHDGSAAGERYLVEVGETCFVASKNMRDVLLALEDKPETLEELAAIYEQQTGASITTEVLADVVANRIPDSLFDHTPEPKNKRPFIFSFNLLSEQTIRPISDRLKVLYAKPIVLIVCALFLVAEYLVFTHSLRAIRHPFNLRDLLFSYIAIVGITLFHELGHASACRRFECPHGDIGFALYFIYPAFYTDVTKVWRLPGLKRAVVDLGGVYFQAMIFIVLTPYVMLTHDLFTLRLLWGMNLMMFFTLNPIFKMDGYWLLSDLSGLSNLHEQMRGAWVSLGRKLFRRPAVEMETLQAQGLRLKVLYVYSVLAVLYYAYIIEFVYGSIGSVLVHYPQRAGYLLTLFQKAFNDGAIEATTFFALRLVRETVWPVILCVMICFMAYRVIGFLFRTLSGVMSGFQLTLSMPRWVYALDEILKSRKSRNPV